MGQYDPTKDPKIVNLKEDRIKYWISVGAQCSETVNNLLVNAGVITGEKKKSVRISKKRQEKMDSKKSEAAEAKEKADKEPKPAEAPAEAAPAAEPKEEVKEEVKEEKKMK